MKTSIVLNLIFFLSPSLPSHLWQEVAVATVICKGKLQGIEVGHFMGGDVGIYTNLYTYIPWIEKAIKEKLKWCPAFPSASRCLCHWLKAFTHSLNSNKLSRQKVWDAAHWKHVSLCPHHITMGRRNLALPYSWFCSLPSVKFIKPFEVVFYPPLKIKCWG